MTCLRKCPCIAVQVCTTKTFGWNAAISAKFLARFLLAGMGGAERARSESWPVSLAVEACPPVLE